MDKTLCNGNAFSNFHDLFLELLDEHQHKFEYKNQPRGLNQREKIMTSFTLTNPIERCVLSEQRKANIVFQYAEFLWYLSGDDKLDFIGHYSPRIRRFSQDGIHLTGTAYGKKIFSYDNIVNQWKWIVKELKTDPDSRRCVITILDPKEMLIENNIDMSCTLSLQFLLRNGQLHMITTMRSNDIFTGVVSDVFSFTMMQELMANELGVDVGIYHHQVGSSHLYEDKIVKTELILEKRRKYSEYQIAFPRIPMGDNWEYIDKVLKLERTIRLRLKDKEFANKKDELPKYWRDVVTLFEIYEVGMREERENDMQQLIESLHPYLQYMVRMKYC